MSANAVRAQWTNHVALGGQMTKQNCVQQVFHNQASSSSINIVMPQPQGPPTPPAPATTTTPWVGRHMQTLSRLKLRFTSMRLCTASCFYPRTTPAQHQASGSRAA